MLPKGFSCQLVPLLYSATIQLTDSQLLIFFFFVESNSVCKEDEGVSTFVDGVAGLSCDSLTFSIIGLVVTHPYNITHNCSNPEKKKKKKIKQEKIQ
jgi:hypothetical protein